MHGHYEVNNNLIHTHLLNPLLTYGYSCSRTVLPLPGTYFVDTLPTCSAYDSIYSEKGPLNGLFSCHFIVLNPVFQLTTSSLAKNLDFIAVSSPTYDQQPPFQWSKSDFKDKVNHIGHPDLFKFEPITTNWPIRKN